MKLAKTVGLQGRNPCVFYSVIGFLCARLFLIFFLRKIDIRDGKTSQKIHCSVL